MKNAMERIAWGVGLAILFAFQAFVVASYFIWLLGSSHDTIPNQQWRGWMTFGIFGCVAFIERFYWIGVKTSARITMPYVFMRRSFIIFASIDALVTALALNWVWLGIPLLLLLADSALSLKFDIKATRQNASISS